jgi:UDP-N-acetylmuramate dehydrogenase
VSPVCTALPPLRGTVEHQGSLADFIWFRTGGPAEWLVRPDDVQGLAAFMAGLDPEVPVLPVGWART